jgi:hypothetical protein
MTTQGASGSENAGSSPALGAARGAGAAIAQTCFGFEAEFTADLRCIPMAVRRKLDLAGVKLKLVHWNGLTAAERQLLPITADANGEGGRTARLLVVVTDAATGAPLQAAQLANAVATLAGRGGDGIIGKLRRNFGLDDFDLISDAKGGTSLRLGRYVSKDIYTEVIVGTEGKSQLNLNLDISPGVTVRGSADSDGDTGIGIFVEKDY